MQIKQKILFYALLTFNITTFSLMALVALKEPLMNSWPGFAIWGFKAKVFYLESMLPTSYFSDSSFFFSHQNYPLSFPLHITYYYMLAGKIDTRLIKLLPILMGGLSCVYLYYFFLERKILPHIAIFLITILSTSSSFFGQSTVLYADNLLLVLLRIFRKTGDENFKENHFFSKGGSISPQYGYNIFS